mgnify:CR=1 FL=1
MRTAKLFHSPLVLKSLYFSFVLSLEFASNIWSPYYICHELVLEKIQRRFLKFLSFKIVNSYPPRGTDYNVLLATHNLESLAFRRRRLGARFIWKIIHGRLDCSDIVNSLRFHVPRPNTRHAVTLNNLKSICSVQF